MDVDPLDMGSTFCDTCDKTFKTENETRKHMRFVHSGVKPFSCDFCSKTFCTSTRKKRHEPVHSKKNWWG